MTATPMKVNSLCSASKRTFTCPYISFKTTSYAGLPDGMDLSHDSSQQAATGHLHSVRQEAVPRASGDDSSASDAGSSSAVSWKPARPKQQASFSPGLAHVHCVAGGAEPWNDELANIKTGSIDCAVEVQVVVQQTPVKVCLTEQQHHDAAYHHMQLPGDGCGLQHHTILLDRQQQRLLQQLALLLLLLPLCCLCAWPTG